MIDIGNNLAFLKRNSILFSIYRGDEMGSKPFIYGKSIESCFEYLLCGSKKWLGIKPKKLNIKLKEGCLRTVNPFTYYIFTC